MIPALKAIMADLTGEKAWRNLRPPLSGLDEEQEKKLLADVAFAQLL